MEREKSLLQKWKKRMEEESEQLRPRICLLASPWCVLAQHCSLASALLLCCAVAALSLWTSAARIFFFAASAVQFHDGRSWHVLEASAVTS